MKHFKSQVNFGDKTQRKDHSGRTGVAKSKIKRPASPYHVTSMTLYQKDGGKGFVSCKIAEEKKLEEPSLDDSEGSSSSSDLRAKWFLSTSQWQGIIPLQIPGLDSMGNEEGHQTDIEHQPACADDVTDSGEMSSTVCESLEKMKENHSLFYKIACDISISDTETTKNDGNNTQPSCMPEEEGPLMAESAAVDTTSSVGRSPNEDSKDSDVEQKRLSTGDQLQSSTVDTEKQLALNTSVSPAKETNVYEEIQKKECEDASIQESHSKGQEADNQASVEDVGSDQGECAKTSEEKSWAKESQDKKVVQERSEELKKSRSYSEESKEMVKERGDNIAPSSSVYEGGRMVRSASFGKARVTVLRTSF